MNDVIREIQEKIHGEEVFPNKVIPIDFFIKRGNKTTKLINNEAEGNFLRGRNSRFEFTFVEPVYVSSITIRLKDYSKYKQFEFSWKSLRRTNEESVQGDLNDNCSTIDVKDVVTDFAIKPPREYRGDPEIQSVTVVGLTLDEFNQSCEIADNLQEYKKSIILTCESEVNKASKAEQELMAFDSKKAEIEKVISELKNEEALLQKEVDGVKNKLEEASILFSEKKSQESDVISRIESLDDSIDQKKNETQVLNSQISEGQEKLKRLRSDINMFPSEFQGVVTQGGRNILWYSILALIPMILLVWYTLVLFNGAIDLTTIYQREEGVDLWSTFLSRLPFVTVSIFIIHFCYAISKVFIRELIRINQQRLDLSKISIVAKDVTDTAISDLDLTDDEIYELRTKLKMDLIKSHLKGYVDDSYEYDLEVGLWQKFINRKNADQASENSTEK